MLQGLVQKTINVLSRDFSFYKISIKIENGDPGTVGNSVGRNVIKRWIKFK